MSSKALDKETIYMNIYVSVDIIIVGNKSCKMQCLVFAIAVKSRVEKEIAWATALALPFASCVIFDNPCASVSCKCVI